MYAKDYSKIQFFWGGVAWNIEFDWLGEQQLVWLALALWCMISIWPVTMAACITWLILSFPLTPLFSKKSSAMFFFSFWICCNVVFFTHEKFIYKWIQTIAKKSFGASHWVPLKEGEWMSGLLYLRSQVLSSGDKLVPSLLRWTGSGAPWTDWVPLRLDQRCCLSYACC